MASAAPAQDICNRSFAFAVRVVKLCRSLDKDPAVPRTLSRQLLQSGTSIGANVEEAQAGQSKADFICKIAIALKEARESNYWLRLIVASELLEKSRLVGLMDESQQLARILAAILVSSKKNR